MMASEVDAQSDEDEIRQGLLPVLSYSSDAGIGIGGMYQFQKLNGPDSMKRLYRVSGNRYINDGFSLRTTLEERFADMHRFTISGEARRMLSAYYFGRGSSTVFNNSDFNKYSRLLVDLSGEYGVRLSDAGEGSRVEFTFGARIGYIENYDIDNTLLGNLRPRGYKGGFRQSFSVGLMGDSRNDLFRPTRGQTFRLGMEYFPSQLGNKTSLGKLSGSIAVYHQFHLITDVVFAGRLSGEQVLGSPPYFELSALGSERTLRGYVLDRFRDHGRMVANFELRTWLFEIPALRMEFGGQLFTDVGAIYGHPFDFDGISSIKTTAGFGGAAAIFNRDFIIRGDVGFSEESWRLYTGIGYMF